MLIVIILLGLVTGSFLNVCIDRLPRKQSIITPRSHCEECNKQLRLLDNIPIISYFWLHGRCRFCGARIPLRIPIVEASTAIIFGFLYWHFGFGFEFVAVLIYSAILIVVFVIDLEHLLVLDKIVYPGMVLALIFSVFRTEIGELSPLLPEYGIVSALTGGILGLAFMSVPYILYRRGMGTGDLKLAALSGLMTGFPLVIIAILISWIMGGIVASILLLFKIKGRRDAIPAAIFLSTSTLIVLVWNQPIWQFLMPYSI
jgi:leader peptidase (prepilin peptidase)/N-methyltransferase